MILAQQRSSASGPWSALLATLLRLLFWIGVLCCAIRAILRRSMLLPWGTAAILQPECCAVPQEMLHMAVSFSELAL